MKNSLRTTNTAAAVALAFAVSACSTQEEVVAKPAAKPGLTATCGSGKGRSKS